MVEPADVPTAVRLVPAVATGIDPVSVVMEAIITAGVTERLTSLDVVKLAEELVKTGAFLSPSRAEGTTEIDKLRAAVAAVRALCAEAMKEGEEPPSCFIDAVDSEGRDTQVPVWVFDSGVQLDHTGSVSAWVEGVAADGELSTGAAIDAIERDARRLLAAAAWHRRVAAATLREPADTKDTL